MKARKINKRGKFIYFYKSKDYYIFRCNRNFEEQIPQVIFFDIIRGGWTKEWIKHHSFIDKNKIISLGFKKISEKELEIIQNFYDN